MTFRDLLKHKDDCCAADDAAKVAEDAAYEAYVCAKEHKENMAAARVSAHAALHDRLAEFGAHFDTGEDGTVTVYTAIEDEPGWRTHHPISGDAEIASKVSEAVTA